MVVRFIDMGEIYYHKGLDCYVEEEGGNYLLVIKYPKFNTKFNIDWIKTEDRVDWLANIISNDLYKTYMKGRNDKKKEVEEAYSNFLKEIYNE